MSVSATKTESASPQFVGIDLGTTNSALAWVGPRGAIRIFDIPQLVATGELGRAPTLPSFLYFPTDAEREAQTTHLPWDRAPETVAGIFAREHGALVPARQVASAKSWLANPSVDRTAKLLPWGFDEGPRLSPVEASARVLAHLRDAWNYVHASTNGDRRLERQRIVVTVPASFDEEARELTVQAARIAGFEHLTLIEEPLAALYAWIAANRRHINERLKDGARVLVCDVGGGTTDFSLIRAKAEDGDLRFERIAIGEHLLLGGDNLDLALAVLVEDTLTKSGGGKLTLAQRQMLRRKCNAAKEQLLSDDSLDRARITILGAGRGVIGGGMTAELTRASVIDTLDEGFLPIVPPDDLPAKDRRIGLRELGLPYESEPAITRHLAAFLTRAESSSSMSRPDAVLFNGGFFTPAVVRERVLDALASWFGQRPVVLENTKPDASVAIGAAFYAKLRENPAAARSLLIRAGTARSYYVGVQASDNDAARSGVCVMPRGTEEGTTLVLDRAFTVTTNQPAAFTLYSSTHRLDPLNAIVSFSEADEVHQHAPLVTVMRFGKRSRRVPLGVGLRAVFTETGTLELWCESRTTDHRWRLAFNLRSTEADPLAADVEESPESEQSEDHVVIPDESAAAAERLIRDVFAGDAALAPEALVGELENALGFGKHAWPLTTIRKLSDVLIEMAEARKKSAAFEVRWLNLTGFCVRPGFGSTLDAWRVSELRKVYSAGLAFPRDIQCQVEWLVLWQRVGAGFSSGQQRELAQRVAGQLGIGQRKPPRVNPQIERESWRLLGSLERLDASLRVKLGDELVDRLRRDARNASLLWAIGRFGARAPFYGPLNSVVPPSVAERWIDRLVSKGVTTDVAAAVVQIGARTDDPARDISDSARERTIERLASAGFADVLAPMTEVMASSRAEATRVFGESLPEGLRLE
jgi:molecular chaperone DnaK (HSP70)